MKRIFYSLAALLLLLVLVLTGIALYGYYLNDAVQPNLKPVVRQGNAVARGAYLARAGNCMACHTVRGGKEYAGGRVLDTEFGQFITPNITADAETGIGRWNADDFWQAMHHGKSKDGSLLYPAFPYPNYTHLSRADTDDLLAFLKTVPAVHLKNQAHQLRFPYNQRSLLVFWRALYFRPAVFVPDTRQSAEWNRGAYLVTGAGHCSACHSSRNNFGANGGSADLSGGEMQQLNWYAPSLWLEHHLDMSETAQLLKHGISAHGVVAGPMAEVVFSSLQYLSDSDIQAMSRYLHTQSQLNKTQETTRRTSLTGSVDQLLDQSMVSGIPMGAQEMAGIMSAGASLYQNHCQSCHGAQGEGVPGVYPALKANQSVLLNNYAKPLRLILAGGFAPVTQGNPRPYGMPPFGPVLSDSEIALVLTFLRNAWGNQASVITPADVNRYRSAPLD